MNVSLHREMLLRIIFPNDVPLVSPILIYKTVSAISRLFLCNFGLNCRKNQYYGVTNENTSLTTATEPNLFDFSPELSQTQGSQCYQTTTFTKILQNLDNNERMDDQLSSFEDLMDILAHTPATTLSTSTQTEEPIDTVEKHQNKQLVSNCVCRCFYMRVNIGDYRLRRS
jgi:hypothetical protein